MTRSISKFRRTLSHGLGITLSAASFGIAVLLTAGVISSSAQAAVTLRKVTVERVVDGDTVHVRDEKQNLLKIRMQGIDSPEWHLVTDAGVVGQLPWGRDAGEALNRMIPKGARVELEDFGHDKYGRTLGHLTHRGRNINIEQVRSGQAISYIICEAGRCDEDFLAEIHAGEVVDACHQAETQGLGVFNPRNRLREMPFEFRLKHQRRKADKFVGNLKTRTYFSPNQYKQVPVCDRIFFLSEKDAQALGFTLDSKN